MYSCSSAVGLRTRIMSSVWTGMACEAGREEREPKVRDPSPLDVHGSNLEGGERGGFML